MLHFKDIRMEAAQKTRRQSSMMHLEPAEVLSVLRAAKAKGAREWAMIVVTYKHGMRASEVCNLQLDDIDLKNGSIIVERLKGSLRTTQAVTEHRGEPLLNELKALREWVGNTNCCAAKTHAWRREWDSKTRYNDINGREFERFR